MGEGVTWRPGASWRVRLRVSVVVCMAFAVAAVWAAPALAHGGSETNTPGDGSTYRPSSPPTSVTVHFLGVGRVKLGFVRVYDKQGRIVNARAHLTGDGTTVVGPLPKLTGLRPSPTSRVRVPVGWVGSGRAHCWWGV